MSLAESNNPIRLVHSALWTMLEADTDFTTLVPSRCRIKYTATTEWYPDVKETLGEADQPQVRIIPTALGLPDRAQLHSSSSSSFLKISWAIEVLTGDQRLHGLMDVAWCVYKATKDWTSYLRDSATLRWQNKSFVYRTQLRRCETQLSEKLSRGIRGWVSIWEGDTDIYLTTTDL